MAAGMPLGHWPQPGWMYEAFGVAGNRAKRMEKKARYDEWAATLADGS